MSKCTWSFQIFPKCANLFGILDTNMQQQALCPQQHGVHILLILTKKSKFLSSFVKFSHRLAKIKKQNQRNIFKQNIECFDKMLPKCTWSFTIFPTCANSVGIFDTNMQQQALCQQQHGVHILWILTKKIKMFIKFCKIVTSICKN